MKHDTQGAVLLAVGLVTLHLAVTDGFLSYVRAGLRWPLILAGAFLVVVGLASAFVRGPVEHGDTDAHGHGSQGARVGLLMVLFVVTVYLVAPAPLGAFAAARGDQNRAIEGAASVAVPDLAAPVDGAIDMMLIEFLGRAYHYPDTLTGVTVRLTGFVTPDPRSSTGYNLTRFTFSCCAADATPLQVHALNPPTIPSADQWVIVEGRWTGEFTGTGDLGRLPVLEITSQVPAAEPAQPYEY